MQADCVGSPTGHRSTTRVSAKSSDVIVSSLSALFVISPHCNQQRYCCQVVCV